MNCIQKSSSRKYNLLTLLGTTASGKTGLAVKLAGMFSGEIISADSRQVFRGMDIGSGKDLHEYGTVAYHLIDILDAGAEFSVYDFQQHFYKTYTDIKTRNKLPILCGGTGLYLDAVLSEYRMAKANYNAQLREKLAAKTDEELITMLQMFKPKQHNTTDLTERDRTIRAIEISLAEQENRQFSQTHPNINSFTIGIRRDRAIVRQMITERLHRRLHEGMIAEVEQLHNNGISWEMLAYYGLEYRYISNYLQGLTNYDEMVQQLNSAIHNFAKRQDTWFRRLEKHGIRIHWLDGSGDIFVQAVKLIEPLDLAI